MRRENGPKGQDGCSRQAERPWLPAQPTYESREFEYLLDATKEFFSQYLKGFGFYFVVLAGLLKLFFEAPEGSHERVASFTAGVALNGFAIVGTVVSGIHYLRIGRRSRELSKSIGIPDLYFPALASTAFGFFCGIVLLSVFWVFGCSPL